jgi:hypothetical protein
VVVVVVVVVAVVLLLRTFTDGLPHGHGVLWTADEQAAGAAAAANDDDDDADNMYRRVAAWAFFWTWSCAVVRFCSGGVRNADAAAAAACDDADDDADNIRD